MIDCKYLRYIDTSRDYLYREFRDRLSAGRKIQTIVWIPCLSLSSSIEKKKIRPTLQRKVGKKTMQHGLAEPQSAVKTEFESTGDSYKVFLTAEHLAAQNAMDFVRSPSAGAIVYFGGTTRDNFPVATTDAPGEVVVKSVVRLEYQAYGPVAIRTLERIAERVLEHPGGEEQSKTKKGLPRTWPNQICKVYIGHRLGVVPVCEESIVIAISAPHRKEGWMGAEWILEEVKSAAEIWKNEVYEDGSTLWKANDGSKPTGYNKGS